MNLRAVVHQAEEGGFWSEVPSLPGCLTQGETMEELKSNLQEAVELALETNPSEKPVYKIIFFAAHEDAMRVADKIFTEYDDLFRRLAQYERETQTV